ncbi:MAG: 3-hydroxy-3-methylglutaryl-CoA reductase [Streptococcaceae bacterium]|jgi:hydroxymethylglutaryl-CoA reductase|nr:3-hydroxy-3-methylglutaryl-CoA reductase [Streptococcaceae bacterium]
MKFYEKTPENRRKSLTEDPLLVQTLRNTALPVAVGNHLIENYISTAEIPMGICFLRLEGKDYRIPMATEEPSVIAAANNGAKRLANFKLIENTRLMTGQIVFYDITNLDALEKTIQRHKEALFEIAKKAYPSIYKRGGGLKDFQLHPVKSFLSLVCTFDTRDAMGANMINTMLEAMSKKLVEWAPAEKILFSILSNEVPDCKTVIEARLTLESDVMEKIVVASDYAAIDSMRTATHNKGILNGIEAVALAHGNDTRAIYLANDLTEPLSSWKIVKNELVGRIEVHLPVATQGGATSVLPKAQAAFDVLGTRDATTFAALTASVGLANNFAALLALTTKGIQEGHMALQARSLALSAGAKEAEVDLLAEKLQAAPQMDLATSTALLQKLRQSHKA